MEMDYAIAEEPEEGEVKKKKKPKLTKAEKKLKKLKEEQMAKCEKMKKDLAAEYELSTKTAKYGRDLWLNMCKEIAVKNMREDVQGWEVKTKELIKTKDNKISILIDDILNTAEIHTLNYSTQLKLTDFLSELFRTFMDGSRLLYYNRAMSALDCFYNDVNGIKQREQEVQHKTENIMHATNLVLDQRLQSDLNIFLEESNDQVSKEIFKRYKYREEIVRKMENLQKQLVAFVNSIKMDCLDVHKYERIHLLMNKQRNFVTESQRLTELGNICSQNQTDLQREILHLNAESQNKIRDLRLEQNYFIDMRRSIEKDMNNFVLSTHEKLRILTSAAFNLSKKYKSIKKKGELLLSLAANCRKFQTESEKIIVDSCARNLEMDTYINEDCFKLDTIDLKKYFDCSEEELCLDMQCMRKFWRRNAHAQAQVILLREKKKDLLEQQHSLLSRITEINKVVDPCGLTDAITIKAVNFDKHSQKACKCRGRRKK